MIPHIGNDDTVRYYVIFEMKYISLCWLAIEFNWWFTSSNKIKILQTFCGGKKIQFSNVYSQISKETPSISKEPLIFSEDHLISSVMMVENDQSDITSFFEMHELREPDSSVNIRVKKDYSLANVNSPYLDLFLQFGKANGYKYFCVTCDPSLKGFKADLKLSFENEIKSSQLPLIFLAKDNFKHGELVEWVADDSSSLAVIPR